MRLYLHSMRRPRHPLARFLSVLLGLAVVGVLLVFGLVVVSVLLVGGVVLLALRQWKRGQAPVNPAVRSAKDQPTVLEGEFKVLNHGQH
ncbi:MAG: hypothetical protein ABI386_03390 [Rhodanobacter sp.]